MKKILFFAMAALFLLTSCDKQSELNVASISGSAKITGRVLYDPGYQTISGGTILSGYRPAAHRAITIEVFYSGANVPGKLFTDSTDENGIYSLDIPVGPTTVNIEVTPVSFVDKYYDVSTSMEIREISASYAGQAVAGVIRDGDAVILADITMDPVNGQVEENRTKKVLLTGEVKVQVLNPKYDDVTGELIGVNPQPATAPASTTVNVTFSCPTDTRKIIYHNQTLDNGTYTIDASLFETWELQYVSVEVAAVAYMTDKYVEYTYDDIQAKWISRRVEGIYQANPISSYLNSSVELTQKFEMNPIIMAFTKTSNL